MSSHFDVDAEHENLLVLFGDWFLPPPCPRKGLLVSRKMLSSVSISREVDTGGAVSKHEQVVRLTIPAAEVNRPANITPCLVNMTLAHWCRLTWVGGDDVIVFGDIFSNFLSIAKDFVHALLNKRAGKSCALPQGQKVVFLIIALQAPQLKSVFLL